MSLLFDLFWSVLTLLLFYSLHFSLLFHSVFGFSDFEWVILLPLFLNSSLSLSPFIPLSRTISLYLMLSLPTSRSISLLLSLQLIIYYFYFISLSLFLSLTFNLSTTFFLFLSLPLAHFHHSIESDLSFHSSPPLFHYPSPSIPLLNLYSALSLLLPLFLLISLCAYASFIISWSRQSIFSSLSLSLYLSIFFSLP